jgi:hypothetical protein
MVLEKDSSLLGYPGETSKALEADHHGVCKYESPKDPNYITVRNILKSLVSKVIAKKQSDRPGLSDRARSRDVKALLAISDFPDTDYIFFRDQWAQGTSDWILEEQAYLDWLSDQGSSQHVLWLRGGAATGKSVLSSFVINSLVERGFSCQYFFIRFGDQKKRTLSLLLRSLAYQIAQQLPSFRRKILELEDEALDFEAAKARTVWERIFKNMLFKLDTTETIYWVIDGLDEANDARAMIKLLTDLISSSVSIRVLLVSRETPEIAAEFAKLPQHIGRGVIVTEGHSEDLSCYVRRELTVSGNDDFTESIIMRIVEGAQSNFLVSMTDFFRPCCVDQPVGTPCC